MLRYFALAVVFACPVSWANTVVTATQDPWPPFVQSGNVRDAGLSVDVVQEALRTQGYTLRMSIMPWARSIEMVRQGEIDVLVATWHTEERTKFLRYSDAYLSNKLKFIMRANNDFRFDGLQSLKGKTVGIVKDYGYGDEFLNATHFTREEAKDTPTNLRKVLANRIDMTIEDEVVAKSQIKETRLDPSDFRFSKKNLSENQLYVTSGLANDRGEEIINAFNKGLKEIKANGTFDKILQKYGL
ncbi:substrate-binding periplasmic protein [Bermanella sp. R86510]|uniref:substrate-binding periplasmic protein n=1 Tax=unclassified Bermanella TaxID=2627862 RepID=UPI0037C5092C